MAEVGLGISGKGDDRAGFRVDSGEVSLHHRLASRWLELAV